MNIVILTSDTPNQVALCNKIAKLGTISHIFISKIEQQVTFGKKIKSFPIKIGNRIFGWPLIKAWRQMQCKYDELYPSYPSAPLSTVSNINCDRVIDFINKTKPDLIVVSGTELIKDKIIESAKDCSRGIINLHSGLSPYLNGGPNCTNWCLALKSFHLIGNTVMYLDKGIDSGSIIHTDVTLLSGKETLTELHWKVMEHSHSIYLQVIDRFNTKMCLPSVPQKNVAQGKTYFTKQWTPWVTFNALKNYYLHYTPNYFASESNKKKIDSLRLVCSSDECV